MLCRLKFGASNILRPTMHRFSLAYALAWVHSSSSSLDPFGFSKNKSAEAKERGLISELNNGRLAQIGILGFLAEQKVEGSVPLLTGLVSHYNGEPMAPVS